MAVDFNDFIKHTKRSGQVIKKFKCSCDKCGLDRGYQPKNKVYKLCLDCVRYSPEYIEKHQKAIKQTRSSPESRAKTIAYNAKRWEDLRIAKTLRDRTAISIIESKKLTHYLYAHYRVDNGKLFYVGISSEHGPQFRRYLVNKGRNTNWHKTVNEAGGWFVKIIKCFNSRQELEQAEIATICLMRFLNIPIVNIATGGGRGSLGLKCRPETIEKLRKAATGKKATESTRLLLSQKSKQMWQNPNHKNKINLTPVNRKSVVCLNNNMRFESVHAAAKWLNVKPGVISYYAKNGKPYKGFRFSYAVES